MRGVTPHGLHQLCCTLGLIYLIDYSSGTDCIRKHLLQTATAVGCTSINLHGAELGTSGIEELATGIQAAFHAAKIELGGNAMGDEGARAIATSLVTNRELVKLCLRKNTIGEDGAKAIGRLLGYTTIRELDLFSNNLGDSGARAMATAVKRHSSLVQLDLRGNQIGTDGILALGDAVANNAVLRKLNLAGNRFGDEGAKALAKMLEQNKALVELDLTGNDISEEGGQALLAALQTNSALVSLNLMWNDVEPATLEKMKDILEKNARKYRRLADRAEIAEVPKRNFQDTTHHTELHNDDELDDSFETDDLELLALQEKEQAFKSAVEKETKNAEKMTSWTPTTLPNGDGANPQGMPMNDKLRDLLSKLQNPQVITGPAGQLPHHVKVHPATHTEL